MPQTNVTIRKAMPEDRLPLSRMIELYQHDLSDIWDQDLDANGEYGYALDRYWADARCHAFIVLIDDQYAGFALVDAAVKVDKNDGNGGHWMDQFFVLKKYRRSGAGKALALAVFAALEGPWEVGQMLNNQAAQAFWRKIIGDYTAGDFVEHKLVGGWWEGYVQCFSADARQ
jgi:predicted acetyltransferase